ncbi:Slit-like 2 protein, partial [Ophiophagus hannah]
MEKKQSEGKYHGLFKTLSLHPICSSANWTVKSVTSDLLASSNVQAVELALPPHMITSERNYSKFIHTLLRGTSTKKDMKYQAKELQKKKNSKQDYTCTLGYSYAQREIRVEMSAHNLTCNWAAVRTIARGSCSTSLKFGDRLERTETSLTSLIREKFKSVGPKKTGRLSCSKRSGDQLSVNPEGQSKADPLPSERRKGIQPIAGEGSGSFRVSTWTHWERMMLPYFGPATGGIKEGVLIEQVGSVSGKDLSENQIHAIPRKAFRGAVDIKNLARIPPGSAL